MKLGYSNYAMKGLDIFEALPRLKEIGYEAMEVATRTGWPTSAANFDRASRERLVELLQDLGFPPPSLMDELPACVPGEGWEDAVKRFESSCELARDLNFGEGLAVVTSTLGGVNGAWTDMREKIREGLLRFAEIAERYHVVIALEPHVGNEFDTPEKAVWLMEATQHDCLKLNFDMSHFHVPGFDLQRCVDLCAPYAVHTHIKDGRREDGKVRFLLPGEGDLDLVAYMNALQNAGLKVPVTVEVSAQIWTRPDYDPWQAAEFCYRALDAARIQAGLS
jgi:sugar phosphate isomerase/epimerase